MFRHKFSHNNILILLVSFTFLACLDELEIETLNENNVDNALVVETVLTNEAITQKVYLSRSVARLDLETDTIYNPFIPLGSRPVDSVDMEGGATITLFANNGTEYDFTENEEGKYYSTEPFALQTGVDYILEINTKDGTEYVSDSIRIEGTSKVTNVYAENAVNDNGEEGVAIYVDSEPLQGITKYYKYAYSETYKVVAPLWQNFEFKLTDYDTSVYPPLYNLEAVEKQIENRTCYNTVPSNVIDLYSNAGNQKDNITKHKLRFIKKDDFIIAQRYSILVQQQVQSADAHFFYKTLQAFSQSDNVFSQIQPGALIANVHRKDNSEENVLGYVEAVGVTDQRLFFNYEDFYPNETPPYAFDCNFETAQLYNSPLDRCPQGLLARVDLGTVSYYSDYNKGLVPDASCPGPYVFVPRICGDCTLLGSSIAPDFWVE